MNPGEQLFRWLLNRYKRQRVDKNSWIWAMSREFDIEELEEFLMRSTILMLLRRLLWNARWYEKRYIEKPIAEERFEQDYLIGTLGFERKDRRELMKLISDSLDAGKKKISPGLFSKLKKESRESGKRCEICGCEIDYSSKDSLSSFSLDHKWPHSLGGVSEKRNLRVSCKRCNDIRQNTAEASDVHYEHFHVKTDWSSDKQDNFWKELNRSFRIAALLKSEFRCEMCGEPVTRMEGGPDFFRKRRDEIYHIFNIQVVCGKHRR